MVETTHGPHNYTPKATKTMTDKPFPEIMEVGRCKLRAGIKRCLTWCALTSQVAPLASTQRMAQCYVLLAQTLAAVGHLYLTGVPTLKNKTKTLCPGTILNGCNLREEVRTGVSSPILLRPNPSVMRSKCKSAAEHTQHQTS